MILLVMKGAPATGKTTYAKKWQQEDTEHRMRVNKDDMRLMLFGAYNTMLPKAQEAVIGKLCDQAVQAAISAGFSVVVDNINIAAKHEIRYRAMAKQAGADFSIKNMNETCTVEEALQRNKDRDRTVPEYLITGLHHR